ncbi:MAG: type II toxin-antitoxin system antitoxin SocA domain-containing protein [Pseudonocardiaceae bacterium]
MARVDDVAAALLTRTGAVTTMKLQKLVFYSQAWHLAFTGQPLFPETIQAWARGPVVPDLHRQHRHKYQVADWPTGNPDHLGLVETRTVEWVVDKYGGFSAEALSRMTHQEVPWIVARAGVADGEHSSEPISHDQMRAFYARQRSEPEVAVAQAIGSAAMEGLVVDDDLHEVLLEVAHGIRSIDDVIAEEIERARRA